MKNTLEIAIPISGNHRNTTRVLLDFAKGAKASHRCPKCKTGLRGWVQMFNTKEYKTWREEQARLFIQHYGVHAFDEPVILCVYLFGGRGFMESADWDNLMKCIGDALVDSNVIAPMPWLKPLDSGNERKGEDDVRHIKGHYTRYLTREEHFKLTGGSSGKKDDMAARIFVKLIPASQVEPFTL